jgi:hypothetical protein
MKKLCVSFVLMCIAVWANAQLNAKVSAHLQYTTLDSQIVKNRSREAMIKMNLNTGEVKLTIPLQSFAKTDTALQRVLGPVTKKMELYFTVDGDPFLLHNAKRNEHEHTVQGMLHINNHYHLVKVRFSVFRKQELTTKDDLAYLISLGFTFLPEHYELEDLEEITKMPLKISMYKQPYSFEHNTF